MAIFNKAEYIEIEPALLLTLLVYIFIVSTTIFSVPSRFNSIKFLLTTKIAPFLDDTKIDGTHENTHISYQINDKFSLKHDS